MLMLSFIIFYVECHFAECYYVQCHYAECRGANESMSVKKVFSVVVVVVGGELNFLFDTMYSL